MKKNWGKDGGLLFNAKPKVFNYITCEKLIK